VLRDRLAHERRWHPRPPPEGRGRCRPAGLPRVRGRRALAIRDEVVDGYAGVVLPPLSRNLICLCAGW